MKLKVSDPEANNYVAYIDGELVLYCLEADEEEGYIIGLKYNHYTYKVNLEFSDGELKPVKYKQYGKVELKKGTIKENEKWKQIQD